MLHKTTTKALLRALVMDKQINPKRVIRTINQITARGNTKADAARMLGFSRAYVTQILREKK